MLSDLVAGLDVVGLPPDAVEVTGIEHDSRRVTPGDLFVALEGERFDGRLFVDDAVERGAVAVLAGAPSSGPSSVPWIETIAPRTLLGPLSARVTGHPDRELVTVGVTGTNGKSTVTGLVAAILTAAGRPAGTIGTLGYTFGDLRVEAERTTPEAPQLYRLLRRMRDAGAEGVALEVSSHALAMGRVAGLRLDIAVFTNLTQDHLDFHQDLESYFGAKRLIFDLLGDDGRAVVNVDDPRGRHLADALPRVTTFGAAGDLSVIDAELGRAHTRLRLATPRGRLEIETPLLGRYNVSNVLAALATAEALGLDIEAARHALAAFGPLEGRMEPVDLGQELPMYIDYAHTPAALASAIEAVREITCRDVVVVFGCGGDRDRGKRFEMGRVAGELAQLPIVTSDNPRSEDAQSIIAEVEAGLRASGHDGYRLIPDRRDAIRRAIAVAHPDRAVLIAGKGHETVQIVGDEAKEFSDRREAERALGEITGAADDG